MRSSVARSTQRATRYVQCKQTQQSLLFSTTAAAFKVNRKLKPEGKPEPLHVPGSGIQHSSQIDQRHGSIMTALAGFTTKLLGAQRNFYAAYQPSMDLYVQAAAQAAQEAAPAPSDAAAPVKEVSASMTPASPFAATSAANKATNQFWYEQSALPPTFQTWFQITQLHGVSRTRPFASAPSLRSSWSSGRKSNGTSCGFFGNTSGTTLVALVSQSQVFGARSWIRSVI